MSSRRGKLITGCYDHGVEPKLHLFDLSWIFLLKIRCTANPQRIERMETGCGLVVALQPVASELGVNRSGAVVATAKQVYIFYMHAVSASVSCKPSHGATCRLAAWHCMFAMQGGCKKPEIQENVGMNCNSIPTRQRCCCCCCCLFQ
jgi:hypothetical protein